MLPLLKGAAALHLDSCLTRQGQFSRSQVWQLAAVQRWLPAVKPDM